MSKKRKSKQRRKRPEGLRSLQMNDLPQLRHARALWKENRLLDALLVFEKTAKSHPFNGLALADASRALGAFYRIGEAELLLDRLLQLANGRANVLQLAGQSYRLIRRPERAMECFRMALSNDDSLADSHLELALLLERRNQLDQASDHIDARLRLIADDGEAGMLKGRLLRRMGETAQSETILRKVCRTPRIFWMTRARAWAELASLLDANGRYDDAWEAMLAGKQVVQSHSRSAREHRDNIMPPLNKLVDELTVEVITNWDLGTEASDHQIALLTGLPRSGTTLLEVMLDAHSKIVACDEFDAFPGYIFPAILGKTSIDRFHINCLNEQSSAQRNKLGTTYLRFLSEAIGASPKGCWLLDKNPSLLLLIPAYFRLLPACRLLVCLRDPRDLLVSCMMTYFPLNDFSVDFLDLSTAAERVAADLKAWSKLRRVLPSNWVEIRYEKLVTETESTIEMALGKMGLSAEQNADDRTLDRPINAPSYEQIARPVYTNAMGRWKNYRRQLEPVLRALEPVASLFDYAM